MCYLIKDKIKETKFENGDKPMKKRIIMITIEIIVAILLMIGIVYYFRETRTYELNLPQLEEITSVTLEEVENQKTIHQKTSIKEIRDILVGIKRVSNQESIQDEPVNVKNKIKVDFTCNQSKIITVFVYEKNNKHYIEQPYNGIYQISTDEYNSISNYLTNENVEITNFYNDQITQEYEEITKLSKDYTIDQAIKDNCFVVNHAKVYNENLYEEFMEKYHKKEFAFIRLVQPTVEGDIFLLDIKYDDKINKIVIIQDNTRDKFSSEEDKKISLKEYEKIGTYRYQGNLFWVAYNGELNNETFQSKDVLILTTIN